MITEIKIAGTLDDIPVAVFEEIKLIILPPTIIDVVSDLYIWKWTDIIEELKSEYRKKYE